MLSSNTKEGGTSSTPTQINKEVKMTTTDEKQQKLDEVITQFCEYLTVESDIEVLTNAAWGLSCLTEDDEGIQSLLSHNVVSKLIELLSHPDIAIVNPCLRILGNIISGIDEQASIVLKEKNFIPELFKLADNKEMKIRRETFWTLSNITAGTPIMFEMIMGNPGYVEKLINTAKNDVPEVRKEALWAIFNSTGKCTPAQIIRILENGIFSCLLDLLEEQDPKLLCIILKGIDNCMRWGDKFKLKNDSGMNRFSAEMVNKGVVDKIEALQSHPDQDVYDHIAEIIDIFEWI